MRLIDADAFIADARMVGLDTAEKVLFALSHQPSAEKQGEWIYCEDNGQDGYKCSECGLFVPWCYEYHDSNFILDYQVCPYCLARMKGADNA